MAPRGRTRRSFSATNHSAPSGCRPASVIAASSRSIARWSARTVLAAGVPQGLLDAQADTLPTWSEPMGESPTVFAQLGRATLQAFAIGAWHADREAIEVSAKRPVSVARIDRGIRLRIDG